MSKVSEINDLLCPRYLVKDYPKCAFRLSDGKCWRKIVEQAYREKEA